VRHGAPVFYEEPHALSGALPWSADDPTPIVLVSFSTVFEQRSPTMLQRALDALRALPVNIVATTGGIVAPGALRAPTNAVVHRFASHEALLSRASLVVTHGGHGTTMRSLRHGVPVVCIPALADDQPAIAAAIRDWGAGISLPRDANVADIRRAAQLVIGNADYRASAARLGAPLAASDGANAAADAFEQLAATRTGTAASTHPPRGHGRFT
jgi:MGT family glycosyltransferase